jgi:O-antigen/teichoic acid export membrane protein
MKDRQDMDDTGAPGADGGAAEGVPAGQARRRGFRKFADFFLLSFGYVGLRFLIGPIRSRLLTEQLGKPHYGALTLAVSTVTFLAMLLALGSYEFLARKLPGLPTGRQKGWLALVLRRLALPGWLLAGAVAGGLWATGWFPSWHGSYVLLLWIDLGLMLWLLERIYYALGGNRIGTMRAIQLFQNDVSFLVVFALGAWAAASFAHTLRIWTAWLCAVALAVLAFDRQAEPAEAPQGEGMREVLLFGMPLMPMVLGEILFRIADRYLLLAFFDLAIVAEYMLAMNIAMMGYVTGTSLLELSLPHLYAAANRHVREGGDRGSGGFWGGGMQPTDEMRRIFSLMLRHVTGLGALMGLGFAFFRRDIFAVIAGPEFRDAASLMPWIAGIPLAFLLAMTAARALLVQNRTRTVGFAMLTAALANLAVDLVVVPLWGTHGAAMATLGCLLGLAAFLCATIDVRRWIDRESWKPMHLLIGIAGCAAADWGIVTLLPDAAWWVRLPLAAIPALLTGWLARIFTPADMALLKAANRSEEP